MRTINRMLAVVLFVTVILATRTDVIASGAIDYWWEAMANFCSQSYGANGGGTEYDGHCECAANDSSCEDYVNGGFCGDASAACEEYCEQYDGVQEVLCSGGSSNCYCRAICIGC
jgi:hypothetical protein